MIVGWSNAMSGGSASSDTTRASAASSPPTGCPLARDERRADREDAARIALRIRVDRQQVRQLDVQTGLFLRLATRGLRHALARGDAGARQRPPRRGIEP